MSASSFTIAVSTPAAAAGAPYAQLRPPAADVPMAITEISACLEAATASSIGLALSNGIGTQSTQTSGYEESNVVSPSSLGKLITAWSVAPTIVAAYLKKVVLPGSIGASVTWTWSDEDPLVIPAGASLVIWNFGAGAGSVLALTARWFEAARYCGPRIKQANAPAFRSFGT